MPALGPQLGQRVALHEDTAEDAHSGEQQDTAEDGVDFTDDSVDGEDGSSQIVNKDGTVDDPGGGIRSQAGETEDLSSGDIAGSVDEHGADQQQKQADKDLIDPENSLVGILLDHLRHLSAAITQADHTGEVVVHSTANDVTDGDLPPLVYLKNRYLAAKWTRRLR